MQPAASEMAPATKPRSVWTMTLAAFGFFGPLIGAIIFFAGVLISGGVSLSGNLMHTVMMGLMRAVTYWEISYVALPAALLSAAVMVVASRRFGKVIAAALVVATGFVSCWLWYGCLLAIVDLTQSFSWRDSLIMAGLGAGSALVCFVIVDRKSVQSHPAVTQGAG